MARPVFHFNIFGSERIKNLQYLFAQGGNVQWQRDVGDGAAYIAG
jgi:hypothetical protein